MFALGAGLAGLSGVVGATALSISPSEDGRYLLSSLVVVIVGGMGSLGGAAIGALIIGLSEQIGLFYAPTYSIFITFVIMAAVLAVRPQGLLGRPGMTRAVRPGAGRGSRPSVILVPPAVASTRGDHARLLDPLDRVQGDDPGHRRPQPRLHGRLRRHDLAGPGGAWPGSPRTWWRC